MALAMAAGSSGDLVADARYEWARGYAAAGDAAAAADLFLQVLERAAVWPPALIGLAEARAALGDRDGALDALDRAISADPADLHGAVLRRAVVAAAPPPPSPPPAYVRGLFDAYAPRFEASLVGELDYRVPERLGALVRRVAPGRDFARALDVGCGTGLMGAVARPFAAWLDGVDLSPGMVAIAAAKRLYDGLAAADAVAFLAAAEGADYDLVLAADVAVYMGDVAPLAAAVARRTAPGALFVFSVESADDPEVDYAVRDSLRYAHGGAALGRTLTAAGFAVLAAEPGALRRDRGLPVEGILVAAERR